MNKNKLYGVVLSMFFIVSALVLSGCTSDNSNDSSWLDTYTPVHSVGNGVNDFWISFPDINPGAGQPVNHTSWVLEALDQKAYIFVVHKTGCAACQPQADRINALGNKYWENIISNDLDLTLGGTTEQKGYEAFYYDPNDAESYIALTGLFTLIKDNGNVTYGWHSWEGDVADAEMETWIKDAIYYYQMNSEK
jgi:hypothetical protein